MLNINYKIIFLNDGLKNYLLIEFGQKLLEIICGREREDM